MNKIRALRRGALILFVWMHVVSFLETLEVLETLETLETLEFIKNLEALGTVEP